MGHCSAPSVLRAFAFALCLLGSSAVDLSRYFGSKPNVIVLFMDDFGWGDVGMNNPEVKETVALDALAASGMTFKNMHTFPLCTPSRAQLLTGRLGPRTGVTTNFATTSLSGLPRTEHTIAELLRPAGYDTLMAGKWHLGTHSGFHPSYRGFQRVLSVPYSVDMGALGPADGPYYNLPQPTPCPTGPNTFPPTYAGNPALPLYNTTTDCGGSTCNSQIAQQPVKEDQLDRNYADFLSAFIQDHASPAAPPFFAYMAFSHTHVPLFFDPKFANSSARNTLFADTTMELDDTVNRIWRAVQDAGLEEDTLILATSDNGPWAVKCELAGTAGPYIGAYQAQLGGGSPFKDTTWEGGQRVFGLAHWKGKIAPGQVSNATVSSLDFLPTILALAGVPLPSDRTYDGVDLAPLLFEGAPKVRDFLFMPDTTSRAGNVTAIHYLHWKAYSLTYSQDSCTERAAKPVAHQDYLIFDLDADPGETTPVRPGPAVVQAIRAAHAAILHDIATTFRSVADYSSGTMVADAPCCNATNALCRCQAQ